MSSTKNSSSIQEMVGALAHEVKNPLSIVRANIDLLESKDKERTYYRNYKVIYKGLDKINSMMTNFLELLKNSTNMVDHIHIDSILNDIIADYSTAHEGIDFVQEIDEGLSIKGDIKRLEMVFNNILKNSVEAIYCKNEETGNNRIEIKAKKLDESVLIEVTDTGIGISDEVLDKLNKGYYSTKETGNGIGIYLCKKILMEHQGSFSIKKIDKGSKVSINIKKGQ